MLSISDPVLVDGCLSPEQSPPTRQMSVATKSSAMAAARASFLSQRQPVRRTEKLKWQNVNARKDEMLSPIYREMQCNRELKRLQGQLNEAEDQLVRMECENSELKGKNNSLIEELTIKKVRIRQLENNEKLYIQSHEEMEAKLTMMSKQIEQMQRHHEIQKEKLLTYKGSEEKWEAKTAGLEESLEAKNNVVVFLERKLRDIHDELNHSWDLLRHEENDRTRLQREVDELKRNVEIEREEYNASIADWRKRLEKMEAEKLAACAAGMDINAGIAREVREKSEQVETLQNLLEEEKKLHRSFVEDLTSKFQENIETLEKDLAETDKTISKYQEELAALHSDKEKLEIERQEISNEIEEKRKGLKEAMLTVECLRDEVCAAARRAGIEMLSKKSCKDYENPGLCEIIGSVIACVRQFEELERRLKIESVKRRESNKNSDYVDSNSDARSGNVELIAKTHSGPHKPAQSAEGKIDLREVVSCVPAKQSQQSDRDLQNEGLKHEAPTKECEIEAEAEKDEKDYVERNEHNGTPTGADLVANPDMDLGKDIEWKEDDEKCRNFRKKASAAEYLRRTSFYKIRGVLPNFKYKA